MDETEFDEKLNWASAHRFIEVVYKLDMISGLEFLNARDHAISRVESGWN